MPDLDWRSALMKMFNQDWLDKLRIYCFHLRAFVWCTTPRKLLNVALIKVQHWLRRDRVIGMPAKYFIDPINVCNLRCPLCPTGRGVLARSRGRMTLADLKQIVHEIAPYAYRVELYNWGEPLLHPDIFDMIKYISQQRIMVGLSSNLNILDANKAQQLVDSGLAQLVVSIDGATQESYAAYRHQGKLDDVLSNLQLLLETRRALKRRTPFVIWRMASIMNTRSKLCGEWPTRWAWIAFLRVCCMLTHWTLIKLNSGCQSTPPTTPIITWQVKN